MSQANAENEDDGTTVCMLKLEDRCRANAAK